VLRLMYRADLTVRSYAMQWPQLQLLTHILCCVQIVQKEVLPVV